ncbi:hypothetical protein PN456_20460 [Nodularia spumigena CS-586/05]|uniref:hypothetical protein n=1 Tax=Nodularia spumigena TaxID=70799 RepID=UPI0023315830|nr:hypothetical protein [Nodularia spumigena]MDB9371281.1 hypothetical protein [Nodularia spumigena CS-586/05]
MSYRNVYTNLTHISQLFVWHPGNVFVGGGEVTLLSRRNGCCYMFFQLTCKQHQLDS